MISFEALPGTSGKTYEDGNIAVYSLYGNNQLKFESPGTWFVYIVKGIALYDASIIMSAGYYGSFLDGKLTCGAACEAFIVHAKDYQGVMQFAGPIEGKGRLKYMDGCTDTCIIAPFKKGDPCLNYLHFPTGVKQTPHTHPDIRVGVVARGRGRCVTPWGDTPMVEGLQFLIHPANGERIEGYPVGMHSFMTDDSTLEIVAFHPCAEIGPTDEVHQMKAQTHLAGFHAPAMYSEA